MQVLTQPQSGYVAQCGNILVNVTTSIEGQIEFNGGKLTIEQSGNYICFSLVVSSLTMSDTRVTAKIFKKQISDYTVEKVFAVINFQSKKTFCDLTRNHKERLRLSVAKKIIEWQQQGVPSNQFEELKKSDLITKFNLRTIVELDTFNEARGDPSCYSTPLSEVKFTF